MSATSEQTCDLILPEIGAGQLPIQISSWLVALGENVLEGDRIVELVLPGITFDVNAPADGRLVRIEKFSGAVVNEGDLLGQLLISEPEFRNQ